MPNRPRRERSFRKAHPQPELCEVCDEKPAACLDHDHTTRAARGWVCTGCNATLGSVDRHGIEHRVAVWRQEIKNRERLIALAPRLQAYLERAQARSAYLEAARV